MPRHWPAMPSRSIVSLRAVVSSPDARPTFLSELKIVCYTLPVMKTFLTVGMWAAVSLLAASALGVVALQRDEPVNSLWIVTAAVCVYALGYRFYAKFIAAKVMALDDRRATP